MKIRDLIVFFLLAYAISWLIWSPMWLPYFGVNIKPVLPYQHGFGGLGPMLSAFITTAIFYKKAGLQALWRRLFQWRPLRWTLVALLLPFAFSLFGGFIARITEGSFPDFYLPPGLYGYGYGRSNRLVFQHRGGGGGLYLVVQRLSGQPVGLRCLPRPDRRGFPGRLRQRQYDAIHRHAGYAVGHSCFADLGMEKPCIRGTGRKLLTLIFLNNNVTNQSLSTYPSHSYSFS